MYVLQKSARAIFAFVMCVAIIVCVGTSKIEAFPSSSTVSPPSLSAESAVLIDALSGTVLCEKNAHIRMAMASTTKIMTALVAVEKGELDKVVSIHPSAVGVEGSSIYLYAGEKMTLRDLLCAMLLESANDAAAAIAIEVGGSVEKFCDMMNAKAKELGLTDTHFTNPHGLFDEEHYTTAYELAKITREALRNTDIKKIVSTKKMTIKPIEGNVRVLFNHNKMLSMYEGAIGVKTGFTKKSGRCLVSAAEREGLTLIAVTINAPDDWNDHKKLLDTGFDNFEAVPLTKAGKVCYMLDVTGGDAVSVPLVYADTLSATLKKGASERLTCVVETYNRFEFAPVKAGKIMGRAIFYLDGERIAETDLVCAADVNATSDRNDEGFFDKIKNIFS